MNDFEIFATSLLRTIARGGKILYNDSLKSFTIKMNNRFVRTLPLYLLIEAWEMKE